MKYEPIPVTPQMVKWARERAGFSRDELSQKFKHLAEWEDGTSSPSYPQLEKMAEEFKIPIAMFFFPEPPDLPRISESFRSLPEHEYEQLPRRIRFLVRKAKVFQLNLSELEGGKNPSKRKIVNELHFDPQTTVSAMAKEVRSFVGISIDEQRSWASTEEALTKWRSLLQDLGVFVFKDQFRQEGYSGFCLYDPEFPLIYVNNTSAKSRQIFTLFHELAHLLFETSGIDQLSDRYLSRLSGQQRAIELKCNQFAAEFLLPETEFNKAVSGKTPTEETAAKIASEFHVSREFVFRRFLDRDWISQRDYEAAAKRWASESGGGSGGNYYNTKFAYLGRDYVSLVFSRFYQNQIDEIQAAEYLDVKPKSLNGLEAKLLQSAA
ncbi:MAG: XRE family transcriptional regulator [Pseudomonadota bacterium]